jgi:hypothetical protein
MAYAKSAEVVGVISGELRGFAALDTWDHFVDAVTTIKGSEGAKSGHHVYKADGGG